MSRSLTTAGVEVRSSSRTSTSTRNPRPTPGHPHSTRKSPYNSHAIIAFGQLHSISKGTAPNTYFVRLCRPNGGPTKVSIMIGSEHYASLRPRIHLAKVEPSKWTLIACGTITGKTTDKRYLRPFDGLSLYLQRTSALGFDNLAQPRTSGPHSGGAPSRA